LDKVESLVNQLGQAGIYTLVDAHQDVFARSMCGEGVPDFYAQELTVKSACITPGIDEQLQDFYRELNFCRSIEGRQYQKD
jgi:hypothetical protein